ncbi:MAG: DUF4214 domain-containing protein [Acidimicrobiales bacterium]
MVAVRRSVAVVGVLSVLVAAAVAASSSSQAAPAPKYATSTTKYVGSSVWDALDRLATPADYDRWAAKLESGGTRADFAKDLFRQREWSQGVVYDIYDQVLIREPDDGGLTYWTNKLQSGFRSANLAAALYASNEFYEGAGGTPSAYVDLIYISILQRPADDAGKAYWVRKLDEGQPRSVIARNFWLTTESNSRRVNKLYLRFLLRNPDPKARASWSKRLVTEDDKALAAALVASDEYYRWSQRRVVIGPTTTTTSKPPSVTLTTISTSTTSTTVTVPRP